MAASDSLEEKLPAEKKYMYFFGAVAKSGVEGELERKRLDKKEELGQRRKENRERFLSRGRAEKLSGGGANPTPGSTLGTFIVNHIFYYGYHSTGCLCCFMCSFIHLCCWFFLYSMDPT